MSSDAMQSERQPIDMSTVRVDPSWALRIPGSLARRKKIIPCCLIEGRVLWHVWILMIQTH